MSFLAYIFPLASKWWTMTDVRSENDHDHKMNELMTSVISENHSRVIIAGPDTANKTSFVFQAAVTAATRGCKVVHICTHRISRLPSPVHGMSSPEPSVMKNVDFLYFQETTELIAYFAGIHMKKKLPSYIIVEDLLSYASQRQDKPVERTLAKLLALLSNASAWISSHNETGKCSVLVTAPSRIKSMQNVLRQFDFHLAVYEGPTKDYVFSKLSFTSNKAQVSLTFQRQKDCIILNDICVTARKTIFNSSENTEKG